MRKTFTTEGPTSLYVEIGTGAVQVHAADTTAAEITVEGRDADDVTVERRGEQIVVIGPQRRGGFLGFGSDLTVTAQVPLGSDLATKLGSADLAVTGKVAAARLKSGSGHVRVEEIAGDADVLSGSGDVEIDTARGNLRVKTGSGHVRAGRTSGAVFVASGSGRVEIDVAEGETAAKTGSGDVVVGTARGQVSMTSGSGDLEVASIGSGSVRAKTASGDVAVAVPHGTPVWTDISCLTGSVRSSLDSSGKPDEGQDFVEVRATTVSGDVLLSHT